MNTQRSRWLSAAISGLALQSQVAFAVPCNTGNPAGLVTQFSAIQYGPDPANNLLNLFVPTSAQLATLGLASAGAVIAIHGHTDSYDSVTFTKVCQQLALNGIACASIEYPFADGSSVFVWNQYAAVNCALRWLRANGRTYNFGTAAIGAYGVSLGGLLTMWEVATQAMTTTPRLHQSVVEPGCPNAATAAGLDAAVIQYGQSDLTLSGPPNSNSELLGAAHSIDPTYQTEFSPLTYLSVPTPQIVSVGNADTVVNPANTGEWVKRLIALKVKDNFVDPTVPADCAIGAVCGGAFSGLQQYWLLGGFPHGYELFSTGAYQPNNLVLPPGYSCAAVAFLWRALTPASRRSPS